MKKSIKVTLICIFLLIHGSTESHSYEVTNKIIKNKKITDQEILEIYNTFVKSNNNQEYKTRYVPLPMHKNNLPWKWENKDFP